MLKSNFCRSLEFILNNIVVVYFYLAAADSDIKKELELKLTEFGLSDLLASLVQQDITLADLYYLNEEDIKGLQLSLGRRKKLQRLIDSKFAEKKTCSDDASSKWSEFEALKKTMSSHDEMATSAPESSS
jgi:hypothetical protein